MRIASNGNIGIGTNNPASILDVVSATSIITIRDSANGNGKIYFGNSGHGVGRNAGISTFTGGNDVVLWTAGDGSVGFCTGSTTTERLRIASNGNIGIGTTNPSGKLDIYDGFIYSNGNKQPFSRTGTVSNSYTVDFPTLFNNTDTTVHTCEIVFQWHLTGMSGSSIFMYGISSGGTSINPTEVGYKDCIFNAVYAVSSGNVIARVVENIVSSTTKIRIVRHQGGTGSIRSHYNCNTIYCWANAGTAENISTGWLNTGTEQVPTIRLQTSRGDTQFQGRWTATYYHV
jgi:hypothetical protein